MAGESQLPPESQPDPSTATMDAISRGDRAEREIMLAEIAHLKSSLVESDRRYEQRFDAQEKATEAALRAAQEAVAKAEAAAEKRFDSVNEFRATLSDQAATLMPRAESTLRWQQLGERVDKLESAMDVVRGRGKGLADSWGYLAAAVGIAVGIVAIILAFNN